jgi:hypothetical protein
MVCLKLSFWRRLKCYFCSRCLCCVFELRLLTSVGKNYAWKLTFFLWPFDPISGHGLPLRGFAITLIGHTHKRQDFTGRVINPTQSPLPDNTQHSQQTDIHVSPGFETEIPAGERQQTHALYHAATNNDGWKLFLLHSWFQIMYEIYAGRHFDEEVLCAIGGTANTTGCW